MATDFPFPAESIKSAEWLFKPGSARVENCKCLLYAILYVLICKHSLLLSIAARVAQKEEER
jgi:hypothetical protein